MWGSHRSFTLDNNDQSAYISSALSLSFTMNGTVIRGKFLQSYLILMKIKLNSCNKIKHFYEKIISINTPNSNHDIS